MFHLNLLVVRLVLIFTIGLVANKTVLAQTGTGAGTDAAAAGEKTKNSGKARSKDTKRSTKSRPKPKAPKKAAARKRTPGVATESAGLAGRRGSREEEQLEKLSSATSGECEPSLLDMDTAPPSESSEEIVKPVPLLTFEEAQDLICRSQWNEEKIKERATKLHEQIANYRASKAKEKYYKSLWNQLIANLDLCIKEKTVSAASGNSRSGATGGVREGAQSAPIVQRTIAPQYKIDAGILTRIDGGLIPSSPPGSPMLNRVYVDRTNLIGTLSAHGINDICTVQMVDRGTPPERRVYDPPGHGSGAGAR